MNRPFLFPNIRSFLGASRTSPPTKYHSMQTTLLACGGLLSPYFVSHSQTTLLESRVSVVPDFSRQQEANAYRRRADCLSVSVEFPSGIFVRAFLKGVWGKLLARSFPHVSFNIYLLFLSFSAKELQSRKRA